MAEHLPKDGLRRYEALYTANDMVGYLLSFSILNEIYFFLNFLVFIHESFQHFWDFSYLLYKLF